MATNQSTVDYILEQASDAGTVTAKKMFGEYGVYCDGKIVAFVCDDELFVKPSEDAKEFIGDYQEKQPYPGAKPYLFISGDLWDDGEWLSQLIRITTNAMPEPKKKKLKS